MAVCPPAPVDVNVAVCPLNSCWKPIRNPGSDEDCTNSKKDYLEHLAYHGGLDASVWRRGVPEKTSLPSMESLLSGQFSQEKMNCVWRADSSCSDHSSTPPETIECSRTNDQREVSVQTSTETLPLVDEGKTDELMSAGERVDVSVECKAEEQSQLEEKSLDSRPDRPNAWLFLFTFLTLVLLQRLYGTSAPLADSPFDGDHC